MLTVIAPPAAAPKVACDGIPILRVGSLGDDRNDRGHASIATVYMAVAAVVIIMIIAMMTNVIMNTMTITIANARSPS